MAIGDRVARRVLWNLNARVHNRMYAYIARHADDDVLFMNWAYEEDPPMALPLEPGDEGHRYPIQLYHATATQSGDLTGKRILEVGCGQGGGASYLTRTLKPASYVGLDLNADRYRVLPPPPPSTRVGVHPGPRRRPARSPQSHSTL